MTNQITNEITKKITVTSLKSPRFRPVEMVARFPLPRIDVSASVEIAREKSRETRAAINSHSGENHRRRFYEVIRGSACSTLQWQ